jgi:hypothetical protein
VLKHAEEEQRGDAKRIRRRAPGEVLGLALRLTELLSRGLAPPRAERRCLGKKVALIREIDVRSFGHGPDVVTGRPEFSCSARAIGEEIVG